MTKKINLTISDKLYARLKKTCDEKGRMIAEVVRDSIEATIDEWNKKKFGHSGFETKKSAKQIDSQKENELLAMDSNELINYLVALDYLPPAGSVWDEREDFLIHYYEVRGEGKEKQVWRALGAPDDKNPTVWPYKTVTNMIKELKGKNLL